MFLPVNGSREALFSFTQTLIDPAQTRRHRGLPPIRSIKSTKARRLLAGAACRGTRPATRPATSLWIDWDRRASRTVWRQHAVAVCLLARQPHRRGHAAGRVGQMLFELSDRHGFVIASDECYSEIYFRDEPPLGGLEAAVEAAGPLRLSQPDRRSPACPRRSNVPGHAQPALSSGDAALIKQFLLYRTYHGSAMSPPVQAASIAAWGDEAACGGKPGALP